MSNIFSPGCLEVICGPMRSGKNSWLIGRVSPLEYTEQSMIIFNPDVNIRDNGLVSRISSWNYETHTIDSKNPTVAVSLSKDFDVVIFVEAQFFDNSLLEVVDALIMMNKNVIVEGLDMDFRGEPFEPMPNLMARANKITKLTAVCTFVADRKVCGQEATRTQRYIDGVPAPFDSPIVLIGDFNEGYEPHCISHHQVPKKPVLPTDKVKSKN